MIADALPVAASHEAVGQVLGDGAMGIRYRTIIEVATEDGTHPLVLINVSSHSLSLGSSLASGLG